MQVARQAQEASSGGSAGISGAGSFSGGIRRGRHLWRRRRSTARAQEASLEAHEELEARRRWTSYVHRWTNQGVDGMDRIVFFIQQRDQLMVVCMHDIAGST